jgi:phage/plasmid-like protein (TIGR03299 family)
MSHEVEKMFYVGETPWHGLGTPIPEDEKLSIEKGIVCAGQDWEVGLAPLAIPVPKPEELENLQNNEDWNPCEWAGLAEQRVARFATYRKTDGAILGTVGPQYRPLQNIDAFKFFEPILEANEAELHTAGSLSGGAKVWILAKLNRDPIAIGGNDDIVKFLLLSNSHDGTTSVRVGFTPIRTVCANTLAMAHRNELSSLIRVRHGKGTKEKLEKIREIMNVANATFEATAEQYNLLAGRDICRADLEKYVQVVLEIKPNAKGEISTKGQNILNSVYEAFDGGGDGGKLMPEGSTWWRAYNALNTRLNHFAGNKRETRLRSLWFGGNATVNQRALQTAVKMVS